MKKLLISVLALVMSVSVALGLTACSSGPSDEEIATKAIDTVNVLYVDSAASTPDDYTVIGQARVDDKLYPIDWSVSPDSAKEYAKVGAMDETTKMVTIDITRTTVDVEYTLKASITVGSVTKTTEFKHSIPKKSSEDAITATLDFSVKDNRTSLDLDNNEQVWKQNGVTLTNTGNVADYSNPIRLYKNTTVSIEMENAKIIHIDFHSAQGFDDSPYPEYLKTSLENSDLPIKGEVTVSEDGLTFGVDFETPQEVVTFKTTAGQCRLTSIDVEAIERDPNEHVHKWTYEHVANTWTHTATCTAEGCDVKTKTEACTPKLNVCECGYTYTAKEIVDALFALETGKSLPGTYSLTGLVTKVTELDTSNYKNVTFDMTVEGQTVTVFRAKGSHYADVREGGYATVNGELLDYNGTKEFTQGGSVVEFSDERTAQQKVDAALKALADTFTVTKAGETELPASTENDVTFTWATTDQTYTIANNKINVTALPAADATVTATVTATCGTETVTNNTKTVTITIKAEGAEVEGFTPITAPAAGSDYYLAMDINGTWYYSTGAKSGNYLGTTTDISKAAKVTVAASGSGWTLVTNGKYIELETSEPNAEGKTYVNIMLKDAQTTGKVWMWNAQYAVFTMEEGGATYFLGTYGAFNTFNSANITYIENDNEYIGKIGTYTGEVTPPTPSDADAMLSFADVANRTEVSTEKQVWKQNGITFTNEKGASTSDINEKYYGPIRLYKSSSAKIEYTSAMKAIVFHCNTADYANTLKSSLTGTGFTVTVDGMDVTVTLDTPSTTFEFTASAGQIRIDSIEVYTKAPAGKTDAEKVADVKAALKLSKTELLTVGEEVELPATQGEATLTWAISGTSDLVKIDGGKLVVLKLPAADTVVTLTVTITVGGASDTADVKITVKAESTEPQPSGTLELTDATLFPNLDGTSYGTYNGTHTVGKYTVTTTNVLGNTQDGYTDTYFLQFKANAGELKVTGSFTKIVIKFVSTYDADNTGNKLTITAGSTTLTPVVKSSEKTGVSNSKDFEYSIHTVEYAVTVAGEQTITIKKDTAYAAYVSSITFEEAAATTPEPDPEPALSKPTQGTEITEEGATVFDFSEVQAAAAELTDAATLLGLFKNAEQAGLTAATGSKVYAGNSTTGGPSADYQQTGGFLRMGTGSANGTLTLTFSKDVIKIQILCLGWSASDTIAIDGFEPATIGKSAKVAYTYTLAEAVKSFTITTAKRALIFKIAVTFADGGAQPEEPGTSVTIPEAAQGTFTCMGGMKDDEEVDPSDVPNLVVTENSIKWGEKTVTILEGAGYNFRVQIDGKEYSLMYDLGGWTLGAFNEEGEPSEMYMFVNMAGGDVM